jgi:hypothetical protein
MTLPSALFVDSKAAVELGVAYGARTVNNLATTPVAFTRFVSAASNEASVNLGNQFVFEVSSLTSAGTYTFTIKVGDLTRDVKIIVEEPVKEVDLKVKTNSTNTVDANHKFILGADGKYYGTLGVDDPSTAAPTNESHIFADLSLLLRNMFPGTENVAYSVTRVTPKTSDTFANVLPYTAASGDVGITSAAGRDGHLQAPALLVLITGKTTLGSTIASETLRSTSINAPQSLSRLDITEAGTYKVSITVAGVTKAVELVVNKYPTLTVKSSDAQLVDETYVVKASADAIKVKLSLEGANLPTGSLFYKVFDVAASNNATDFYNGANYAARTTIRSGTNEANSFDLLTSATQPKSLTFTSGLIDVELTIAAGAANNTKLYQVIGIYSRIVKDDDEYTYKLVGHIDIALGKVSLS